MKAEKKNKLVLSSKAYRLLKILLVVAFIISFFQPITLIYQQRAKFFSRGYEARYEDYRKAYYTSQYVQKKNPGIIPDEIFEAFAAGAFLKGMNPILIVHDHPPLGRYILSLSIVLFDNVDVIILPLLALSLIGIFLIARLTLGNTFLALIPILIFMNEPLFVNKIVYSPIPEAVHLPFIVFTFYFFMKSIKSKKPLVWYLLTAIMLGFVISIRFFVLGAVVTAAMGIFLLLRQRDSRRILQFGLSLPLALLVLFLSYTRTMLDGYSPLQILGVQKYILDYHKSLFILPFSYWDLLLFNRWHTWWGNRGIISDSNWIIIWPISVLVVFCYSIYTLIKKIHISDYEVLLLLWIILYSIILSTGYTSTRYFLPILPFVYILATSFITKLTQRFIKSR